MAEQDPGPDDILGTYERVGGTWAAQRNQSLVERRWLERFLAAAPGKRILDLGCGSGRPIAKWLHGQGCHVTGVDATAGLCASFARTLPMCRIVQSDMRHLALGERFDGLLAWNSFFHLSKPDQREMFSVFAAHSAPGAALMFTSGPADGEAIGEVAGEKVYHASLDPGAYRALLQHNGFEVLAHVAEDPDCAGHTIWLARRCDRSTGA